MWYIKKRSLTIFLTMALTPGLAISGDEGEAPNLFMTSLKSLSALLIVLALIILAAWAVKRYFPYLQQNIGKGDDIKILAVKALGPKRSIHLIEVEGKKVLVGSSETGVTLLKEFSDLE